MTTILIVDDDKMIALALTARLKATGYEVQAAYDGMQAVSAAVKYEPDLIIMDINMPAGSGIAAAQRIQDLVATTGTPIIFLTASQDPDIWREARQMGQAVLSKPYDSDALMTLVADTLAKAA